VTGFLGVLMAAVVGGLIQRGRSSEELRWRYIQIWVLIVAGFAAVAGASGIVIRGGSKSSFAIAGIGLVLAGSALCLLFEGRLAEPPRSPDGWVMVDFRPAVCSATRRVLCIAWGILTLLFLTAVLRYSGAFVREPVLSNISAVPALGQLEPLRKHLPVRAGQCLETREVLGSNDVGACSIPHRSEVISEVDVGATCPSDEKYDHTGLDAKVVPAGPFGGSLYCVLQSSSPALRWTGRPSALLPPTA